MLGIFFLLSTVAFGFSLAYLLPLALRIEERVFAGVPIGLAAGGLTGFVYALLFGMDAGALLVPALLGAVGTVAIWRRAAVRRRIREEFADVRARLRTWPFRVGAVLFGGLAAALGVIMWQALFAEGGTIYVGFSNVWGDWNQHLAQTTSFAYGENFPSEQTVLSGQKITYPLLTNFASALLVTGGFGLLTAMKIPGVLLVISGLGMLTALLRLTAGPGTMLVGAVLFYAFGGLGFVNFFTDLSASGMPLGEFLRNLPHEYTLTFGEVPVSNINFINPIFAYIIPQRAFLFGLPITLTVLCLLYAGLRDRAPREPFLAAGLIAALLPLVHTHSLVFLGLLTPGLALLTWKQLAGRRRRRFRWKYLRPWLYFVVPILLLALPQVLWLSAGVQATAFLRPQFGWTAHGDFLPWFWLKNLGLFLPLLLMGFFWLRGRDSLLLRFTLAAGIVWVLTNLLVFQPWDWDNTKFLVYWLVLSIPAVSAFLVWLFGRGRVGKASVIAIFPFLVLAGLADVTRTLPPNHYRAAMFDERAQRIAMAARESAAPDSIWLTAQQVNNPFASLAGQRLLLGYTGWLWSYGLEYAEREDDVRRMYEGVPETPALLRHYGVDFVVIGPAERGDEGFTVNERFFARRYPVWERFPAGSGQTDGPVTVYRVSAE